MHYDETLVIRDVRCKVGEAKQDIEGRLLDLGYIADSFYQQVIDFYNSSLEHYLRLIMRDGVAAYLATARNYALDMTKENDRYHLWSALAEWTNKGTCNRWANGYIDPPPDKLWRCIAKAGIPIARDAFADTAAPTRMAISRTLTYIRVYIAVMLPYPEARSKNEGKLLKLCKTTVESHPHYKQTNNLNQHCLDRTLDKFSDQIHVPESGLGALKHQMDTAPRESDPLFWPWAIFKFVTFERFPDPNRQLWKRDTFAQYPAIWGAASHE